DVLAVVALRIAEPEEAFLEPIVLPVPERNREVQEAVSIADPAQAVLAPPIASGVGLIEREVVPGVTVGRVVLADGAPLPASQIWTPQPPRVGRPRRLREPGMLGAACRMPQMRWRLGGVPGRRCGHGGTQRSGSGCAGWASSSRRRTSLRSSFSSRPRRRRDVTRYWMAPATTTP